MLSYQLRCRLCVFPGQVVFNGFLDQTVFGKPSTGSRVKSIDVILAEVTIKLVVKQLLKQMVVTKPAFFIVKGNQKKKVR